MWVSVSEAEITHCVCYASMEQAMTMGANVKVAAPEGVFFCSFLEIFDIYFFIQYFDIVREGTIFMVESPSCVLKIPIDSMSALWLIYCRV